VKFICDLDRDLPETVRIHLEWRTAFRMTRFRDVIREMRVHVRSPLNDPKTTRYECCVVMRLLDPDSDGITVQESADEPKEAISVAIDRAAASLSRQVQRRSRLADSGRRSFKLNEH
jgi:ribosome-associated translation inhibitor RaiA